jgi:hypothetical protein
MQETIFTQSSITKYYLSSHGFYLGFIGIRKILHDVTGTRF